MHYQFIRKSSNSKTGSIPVTNSPRSTCPDVCPLKDKGCYAEAGYFTRLNWDKVDSGLRGGTWPELCDSVAALPVAQLWRHDVSGDLPHNDQVIDRDMVNQLVTSNKGKKGFTYTHHDLNSAANRDTIKHANGSGFTVNLSADSPALADTLTELGIGPVVTLVPEKQLTNTVTPAGRKIVICPAVVKDTVSCASCGLCQKQNRPIIGFPAHGQQKRQAEQVIQFNR